MDDRVPGRKAVLSQTPGETIAHKVSFTPQRFNELVGNHGYEVYIDKALVCPCSVKNSGSAVPNCNNCLGKGWFFVDRRETIVAVQSIKMDIKYENWSKENVGNAKVTARAIDKLGYMDRIILKEVEGYYNEIVRSKQEQGGVTYLYAMYDIIEIESLFLFKGTNEALVSLRLGEDFTLDPVNTTKIILTSKWNNKPEMAFSMRYKHFMTYHISEMNRDNVKVRTKGCLLPEGNLESMPVMGYARKAHYVFDNIKFDEAKRLIDNNT